ncbi:MAG: hypothetical protein ACOYN0_00935 [Phycisphaerales bacterium]
MHKALRSEVTDDRGQVRPGIDIDLLAKAEDGSEYRLELAKRLKLAVRGEAGRNKSAQTARAIFVLVLVVGALGIQIAMKGRIQLSWHFALFGLGAILIRWLTKRKVDAGLSATAVDEGFCGSCGYSLRSTPAHEDGCIQCPECGAAWKADRITRPHWDTGPMAVEYKVGFWERVWYATPSREFLTVADDRGRYVRSLDRWLRYLGPERRAKWGEARIAEAIRRLARIGRPRRLVIGLAQLILTLVPPFTFVFLFRSNPLLLIFGTTFVPWAAVVFWLLVRGSRACSADLVVREIAGMGYCGACGESLETAPVEADGCRVCPECRAAWKGASA